jgi:hypothetical protein
LSATGPHQLLVSRLVNTTAEAYQQHVVVLLPERIDRVALCRDLGLERLEFVGNLAIAVGSSDEAQGK